MKTSAAITSCDHPATANPTPSAVDWSMCDFVNIP
jgi:hypothetical protein